MSKLSFGMSKLLFGMSKLSFGMSKISSGMSKLLFGMSKLSFRMSKLLFGMSKISSGMSKLPFGMSKISSGMSKSSFGMSKLTSGMSKSSFGMSKLPFGMSKLLFGSHTPFVIRNYALKIIFGRLSPRAEAFLKSKTRDVTPGLIIYNFNILTAGYETLSVHRRPAPAYQPVSKLPGPVLPLNVQLYQGSILLLR